MDAEERFAKMKEHYERQEKERSELVGREVRMPRYIWELLDRHAAEWSLDSETLIRVWVAEKLE